jgi:ProP effector
METKRTSTKELIAYLAEKYPACFSIEGAAKPLKIGIFQDIAAQLTDDDNLSKTRLRQALRHYTSSWRYLKSIKLGVHRIDLSGEQAEEIDKEQADHASKTLKASQEKFSNKNRKEKDVKQPAKGAKLEDKSEKRSAPSKSTTQNRSAKFKAVTTSKVVAKKAEIVLKPVELNGVSVGNLVKVKLGNAPMSATITEIAGKDVSVQLDSGMVIKTQIQNIYSQ